MFGDLFSGLTTLIGGKMSSEATQKANQQAQRNFEQQMRTANAQRDQDYERQEHFAKHGIQWRAADAKAAGIHPLYALGANTSTFSPSAVSVGAPSIQADTAMGSAVASMGQDIGRAINSTRTNQQREDAFNDTVKALTVQKLGLENDLLASQIKRMQVNANPAFPGSVSPDDNLRIGGVPIKKDPLTTDMQKFSDRYGDEGLAQWTIPPLIMFRDYQATTGGKGVDTRSWPAQVGSAIARGAAWLDRNIKVFPTMTGRREWTDPR